MKKAITLKKRPARILVVPLRYIGDTILTVPLLRNLRQNYPDAEIDVLTSKTAMPLLEHCPYVNTCHLEPRGYFNMMDFLKWHHYDLAIILRKSFTMALYCKLAGIPTVLGYDKQRFPWGYKRWALGLDAVAEYPGLKTTTPQAVSHVNMLDSIKQPVQDYYLELWTTPEDEQAVDKLLKEKNIPTDKPLAVVHTVSASHGKSIEPDRFLPSIEQLLSDGYDVIFTGIDSDRGRYKDLLANNPMLSAYPFAACHNLAGLTSLRETVALYKRVQVLLTVDSSPVHMGLAVGIPKIIAVYGPTNHIQWGSYEGVRPKSELQPKFMPVYNDLPCRPCYAKTCEHNNCRVQLDAELIRSGLNAKT